MLALAYPNGRVRECELEGESVLQPGSEFDLYGRRWRVDHFVPADHWHREPRWYCLPVGPGPFDRPHTD